MTDEQWMLRALDLARQAQSRNEVPVGAVVVSAAGELLGEGYNQPISSADPTAHAEMVALRAAARNVGNYRLPGSTLYVTLEPCLMCAGALIHARVERLVFATSEPKSGAVVSAFQVLGASRLNHQVGVESGVLAEHSAQLLHRFFADRRLAAGENRTRSDLA